MGNALASTQKASNRVGNGIVYTQWPSNHVGNGIVYTQWASNRVGNGIASTQWPSNHVGNGIAYTQWASNHVGSGIASTQYHFQRFSNYFLSACKYFETREKPQIPEEMGPHSLIKHISGDSHRPYSLLNRSHCGRPRERSNYA